jgi:hypothetical protein
MTQAERRSAIRGLVRSDLRTGIERRPPRHSWDRADPWRTLWQLTTRPPRRSTDGWGSGSPLPVETRGPILVRAGRTAGGEQQPELVGSG